MPDAPRPVLCHPLDIDGVCLSNFTLAGGRCAGGAVFEPSAHCVCVTSFVSPSPEQPPAPPPAPSHRLPVSHTILSLGSSSQLELFLALHHPLTSKVTQLTDSSYVKLYLYKV